MKIPTSIGVLVLLLGRMAPQSSSVSPANRVQMDPVETALVRAGGMAPLEFTFHIQNGYHINSNRPQSPELKASELRFTPPTDLIVARVQYPAGELTSFPFDPDDKLSVYSGS